MGAAGLPLGLIGSSLFSGLLSPEPDELGTFAGRQGGIDPSVWLRSAREYLDAALKGGITRADEPVVLPEPDFDRLPTYSGGGLPFSIGVPPKSVGERGLLTGPRKRSPSVPDPDQGEPPWNAGGDGEDSEDGDGGGPNWPDGKPRPRQPEPLTDAPLRRPVGTFRGGQSLFAPRRLDARTTNAAKLLMLAAQQK